MFEMACGLAQDIWNGLEGVVSVGIQGSYARGEAGAGSDVDLVVILERCTGEVLDDYSHLLDSSAIPRGLLCGFVSSLEEIMAWDRADRVSLVLDTKTLCGTPLSDLVPVTPDDIAAAARQSICQVLHPLTHIIIHERDWAQLGPLFKSSRFALRLVHALESGSFVQSFTALAGQVSGEDLWVLENREYSHETAIRLRKWLSCRLAICPQA